MLLILCLILKAIWKIIEGWDVTYITTIRSLRIDIATLVVFASAVLVSIITYFTIKKRYQFSNFLDLRKEYRSSEVGIAIQRLWELREVHCRNREDYFIEEYVRRSKGYNRYKKECIHNQRRMVSQLYQQLENMWSDKVITKEKILRYWSVGDLRIIKFIIVPLETIAVPLLMGKKKEDLPVKKVEWLEKLENLYNELSRIGKEADEC